MKEDTIYIYRILIVDDEPDILSALKIVIEENGFKVDGFDDPVTALDTFRKALYDLLILDIKMPKMDGFELYDEIKKIDNKIRVCFLSAISNYQEFTKYFPTINESQVIVKPVENQTLIERINKIMSL